MSWPRGLTAFWGAVQARGCGRRRTPRGTGAGCLFPRCLFFDVFPAADLVVAADDAGNGFGVGEVFFGQDPRGEGMGIIGVENRNRALDDDGAVIELFVDEMNSAAGYFDAVIEGLLLRVEARKRGQTARDGY